MKKMKKLFLKIVCFIAFGTLMAGCGDGGTNENHNEQTYNDTPLTAFTGTRWTDDLIPESTIEFTTGSQINLVGRYWNKRLEINGQQQPINLSGPHTYEAANNLSGDQVEPAVYILMNGTKRTGIELYYYKADTKTGKHQRLVVYATGILQPREFYLH